MGYTVDWFVQDRVYVFNIWGDLTLDDYHEGSTVAIDYVCDGHPPVHSILDVRNVTDYPKRLSEIRKVTAIMQEPNLGWVLVVSDDRFIRFVGDIVSQLSSKNYKAFATPEEAIAFLWHMDTTLPEPPPSYLVASNTEAL